jgi:hypothetical protein
MSDEFVGFLIVLVIAATIYKIVALKHTNKGSSKEFQHMLAEELADRDDKANALEERLRVVEKIVTDNHTASALSEEIENLKEK